MLLATTGIVHAATTIGTNISTDGSLTVTDASALTGFVNVGPSESTLPVILQGYLTPTAALITDNSTNGNAVGIEANSGVGLYIAATSPNNVYGSETEVFAGAANKRIYGDVVFLNANEFATTQMTGFYFGNPGLGDAGTVADLYAYWSADISGIATNGYYSWFDSRGVRRVKEDSTFNGVGQAIEALYNPQFTKYTPGATNYERIVLGQWNSNVAEIGAEAGGTGTLRPLRLIGSSVDATAYKVGGVAGVDRVCAGAPTAMTVTKGIITSITCP